MTRFPAEFIFPGEWFLCVLVFEWVRLTECLLYAIGYLNISVVCMPLEVNRIPLDLFMVLFIGLVFRNDVTSSRPPMRYIIACQKYASLLTIEQYPMVNLSANSS